MGNGQSSKNNTRPESSRRVVQATRATRTPTLQPQVLGNIRQNVQVPQVPCSASQALEHSSNSQTGIDIGLCVLCEKFHVDTKSQTTGQAQASQQSRPDERKSEIVPNPSKSTQTTQSINQGNDSRVCERSQAETQAIQSKPTQRSRNSQIRQGEAQQSERIRPGTPTPTRKKETMPKTSQSLLTAKSIRQSNYEGERNSTLNLEMKQKNDSQNSQNSDQNVCVPEIPKTKRRPTRDDPWISQTGQSRDFELCVFCEQNNAIILKNQPRTAQDEPCHSQTGQSCYVRLCVLCEENHANFLKQREPSHPRTLVTEPRPIRDDPLNSQRQSHNVEQSAQSRLQMETQRRSTQDLQKSQLTTSQINIHEIRRIPTEDDSCTCSHTGQSHGVQPCRQSRLRSRDTQRSLTEEDWLNSQIKQSQVEQFEKSPVLKTRRDDSWYSQTDLQGITVRDDSKRLPDHDVEGIGENEHHHPVTTPEYQAKLASKKLHKLMRQDRQSFSCISLNNTVNARYSEDKKSTAWCYKCQTAYRMNNEDDEPCQHLRDNCTFKEIQCPYYGCNWEGSLKPLFYHLDNLHEQFMVYVGSETQLQAIDNISPAIHLVHVDGYHFLFHVRVSRNRKVYMTVQFVGSKRHAAKWFYEIQVYDKSNFRRKYTFTDTCRSIYESVDDIFAAGDCSVLSKTYASSFLQNDTLCYKFFIRRINRGSRFHNNHRVKAGSDQREARCKD